VIFFKLSAYVGGALFLIFLLWSAFGCNPIGSYRVVELNGGKFVVEEKITEFGDWFPAAGAPIFDTKEEACKWIENKKHERWLRQKKRVVECDKDGQTKNP